MRITLLSCLLVYAGATLTPAVGLHVNDDNIGTAGYPYAAIRTAINAAASGDTIHARFPECDCRPCIFPV